MKFIGLVSLVHIPLLTLSGAAVLVLGLVGCDYPKKIQEFPEPWQVLDPGKPLEKFPKIEVIKEGGGPVVAAGDLVQIHVHFSKPSTSLEIDSGDIWIWMGFRGAKETAFFSYEPGAASSMVGLKQGTVFKFTEPKAGLVSPPWYAGEIYLNVFGDTQYYRWRKNTEGFETLYVSHADGLTALEIKRVCKGQTKSRTVRLFDDSPVQVCSGLNCRTTTEAREAWIDEARSDAVCQDGKKVSFQYGPIGSRNGKEGRSPKRGYFDEWLLKAWDKIPRGVRFEGNHAPVIETTPVKTKTGVALAIDFRKFAKDVDGDPLTARIIRPPENGKLNLHPDGSTTYTPKEKFSGFDHATFGISDGMTETVGTIEIEVSQPAG